MTIEHKLPKWAAHWRYWGLALGSDDRYKPRWYERRAYLMGLRDAARITEEARWRTGPGDTARKFARVLIQVIHRHAFVHVFNFTPSSDQLGPWSE